MTPVPTRQARYAFAGCVGLLSLALVARSVTLVVLAATGLLGLSLALALTLPLANRLRRQRLEFAWWHAHAAQQRGAAVTVGAPFVVRCYVRNRSAHAFELRHLQPALPGGTRCVSGADANVDIPAGTRVEFELTLNSAAAGRVVAQGLSVSVPGPLGLFEAPLYFPTPLTVKVLPRAGAARAGRALPATGLPVERPGPTLLREHGGGTELRELRELQPGDPFKSIAWKASARRGKLLVKEVEREVQETRHIVVDVSGSMRGGPPGTRKLDLAIELAALEAREAIERGDRVGLLAVDGRVVSQVPAGEGRKHMLRVYDALLRTTEVVDADLTAVDDDAVAQLVTRYMRQQEGLELPRHRPVEAQDLAFHAQRTLPRETKSDEVVAGSRAHAVLRRYCRVRGIPLAYRAETRGMAKTAGLVAALKQIGGTTRVPRSIIVITDFDAMEGLEPLRRTLAMLRRHGHALTFAWPDPRAESAARASAQSQLHAALHTAFGLQEQRRAREASLLLGRLGIPLVAVRAGLPATRAVARARHLTRAA